MLHFTMLFNHDNNSINTLNEMTEESEEEETVRNVILHVFSMSIAHSHSVWQKCSHLIIFSHFVTLEPQT